MNSEQIKILKEKYSYFSDIYVNKKINKSSETIGFNVAQINNAYNFDNIIYQNSNIHEQEQIHIIIIIAYSNPNLQKNLNIFCKINNIPTKKIEIVKINPNTPSNSDWSSEICIDTQWSHAIFPKSKITVVEAESSSITDLLVAIEIGKTLNPDIINMSWGVNEFNKCDQIDIFNNSSAIFIASSGDENEVQWPSTNPNVLAIGATSLYLKSNDNYNYETTWSNTGCGYSQYFPTPNYQLRSMTNTTSNRSTVDLSIVGNPDTGCYIYDNGYVIYGGTSLSAPIISGTLASVLYFRKINNKYLFNSNQYSSNSIQNILYDYYGKYGSTYIFHDIIKGITGQYHAQIGYDLPTGLGSPKLCDFFCYLTNINIV